MCFVLNYKIVGKSISFKIEQKKFYYSSSLKKYYSLRLNITIFRLIFRLLYYIKKNFIPTRNPWEAAEVKATAPEQGPAKDLLISTADRKVTIARAEVRSGCGWRRSEGCRTAFGAPLRVCIQGCVVRVRGRALAHKHRQYAVVHTSRRGREPTNWGNLTRNMMSFIW